MGVDHLTEKGVLRDGHAGCVAVGLDVVGGKNNVRHWCATKAGGKATWRHKNRLENLQLASGLGSSDLGGVRALCGTKLRTCWGTFCFQTASLNNQVVF